MILLRNFWNTRKSKKSGNVHIQGLDLHTLNHPTVKVPTHTPNQDLHQGHAPILALSVDHALGLPHDPLLTRGRHRQRAVLTGPDHVLMATPAPDPDLHTEDTTLDLDLLHTDLHLPTIRDCFPKLKENVIMSTVSVKSHHMMSRQCTAGSLIRGNLLKRKLFENGNESTETGMKSIIKGCQ